jgi:hypothetical protein
MVKQHNACQLLKFIWAMALEWRSCGRAWQGSGGSRVGVPEAKGSKIAKNSTATLSNGKTRVLKLRKKNQKGEDRWKFLKMGLLGGYLLTR